MGRGCIIKISDYGRMTRNRYMQGEEKNIDVGVYHIRHISFTFTFVQRNLRTSTDQKKERCQAIPAELENNRYALPGHLKHILINVANTCVEM